MAVVSLRGYARHRGVNLYAVQKAIKTGRITTRKDGRIDTELADREWEQNTVARPIVVTKKEPARREPSTSPGNATDSEFSGGGVNVAYSEQSTVLLP